MSEIDFEGLGAIVTGGNVGIGRSTALALARRGARVGIIDLYLDDLPDGIVGAVADVADVGAVADAVNTIAARLGRLDILVNNAGVSHVGGVEDGELDVWNRLWDINVVGYVRVIRAALPLLRQSPAASIVNMSSCTAESGIPQRVLYSATKGAIEAMTRALAADLVQEGIRVNCVSPGTVDTPFMANLAARTPDPASAMAEFAARQPTGHMVDSEEVAEAVCFLADPTHRSMVGAVLTIDGGLSPLALIPARLQSQEQS